MDFYPLFARLRNQPCLVIGGGEVAARKARELVAAGARVTVVAPEAADSLRELAAAGRLEWLRSEFHPGLLADHLLVVAATGDPAVNHAVARGADEARRLCNVVDDADASSFIVPGIVDRSPLVVAVSSGGHSPVLARLLRQRIEAWLPRRLGALARWAGHWRERVRARFPDMTARRRFWERVLEGPAAGRALAGDEDGADRLLAAELENPSGAGGMAWLVGAGPGDPGLISVRGLRALESADVVLHDRLVDPDLLRAARRDAELVSVGKTGGGPSASQDDINRRLVAEVRAGRRVCRLKGGDPLVFGRGGEEALALAAAGLPFEIIPGITAASGCAAAAGIPLTHRGTATAVTFVTARGADGGEPDWAALARPGHTLAVYMGGRQVADIATRLVAAGLPPATGVAVISGGTTAAQQVFTGTLADIGGRFPGPAALAPVLMIVGDTVALARQLAQHADSPLLRPAALGG